MPAARGGRSTAASGRPLDGGPAPAVDGGLLLHCATVAPTGPVIADFDGFNNQAFGVSGVDPVIGITFVTPGTLLEDFTNGNWHITGAVTGPVSFGFYWRCPGVIDGVCSLDLSRYAGIQYTINGDFGAPDSLQLTIGTIQDERPTVAFGCGICNVPDGIGACTDPYATLSFATAIPPAMLSLTWLSFQSGDPYAHTDQQRVASITWTLPAAADGGSYPVDFTLDDIRLIPIPH